MSLNATHKLDWHLPNKEELQLLYEHRNFVGGFSNHLYWSSTESNSFNAWFQNFFTGHQLNSNKNLTHRVRTVRSFWQILSHQKMKIWGKCHSLLGVFFRLVLFIWVARLLEHWDLIGLMLVKEFPSRMPQTSQFKAKIFNSQIISGSNLTPTVTNF